MSITVRNFIWLFGLLLLISSCASTAKLYVAGSGPEEPYNEKVPFTRSLKLIILNVDIEGESFRFLFDTGAPMVVTPELAEKFNLKKVASKYVTDSSNKRNKQEYVKVPSVTIGKQEFKDLVAIVVDLKFSSVIACLEIDGIVGANLMRHAVWKIDYVEEVMYFSNNMNAYQPKENAIVLPFRTKATFTPVVDLMIDSNIVRGVTFDTGSGFALSTGQNSVPNLDKKSNEVFASYGYHSSGVFGSIPDSLFNAQKKVTIGKTVIDDMVLSIHHKPRKALLGTSFMEDYEVIINWEQISQFYCSKYILVSNY